ncbi:hypothetical protein [Streptomyces sp. NPDC056405]|uniref:hypothetical protein n=1 Tax=Streptomyces sp. NPDC056405 TaxID=3345811 RepID=UPI0035DBC61A
MVLPEGQRARRIVGWVRLPARTVCATYDRVPAPFEKGGDAAVPSDSPSPYSERPVAQARRAKARELVERLLAEGRVRLTDPSDDEVAEWRRVVNYAKRHGMEPEGRRIEKAPYGGLGLEFFLAEGPHPNARSQRPAASDPVPVPARLVRPHPAVAALRDDDQHLVMPSALRRRSLLLFQGLAAEAKRRAYEVQRSPVPVLRA